jgi:hypothetical protein
MLRETAVLGMIMLLIAPSAVDEPLVDPPTENFSVQIVSGPNCRHATLLTRPDNSGLNVWYGDSGLKIGGPYGTTAQREQCQLALDVSMPEGYTFAVARVVQRGMGELADGIDARLQTRMWPASGPAFSHDYRFTDAFDHVFWETAQDIEPAARVWAPCGTPHRLRLEYVLRLSIGTADPRTISYLILDATVVEDGGTEIELAWKRCSPETPLAGAQPGPTVDGMAHEAMTTTPGNPRRSTAMR